ncbi:hypothetical protein EMIHUDRAFT_241977 [Emiliania huxleyi CCMP1516]|uniref:Uncharacterized protein n=2 Tax=Emiliania huxleyi TaxID=2903 RepID=A0A0D3JAZ0_EMIH1|nr:hypothetical protein EMIHUDRAFT_241977 [Emiliania huxleyi CCMP1516]EOD20675.1 hypothetical protein EMIHUDRAFT_241977 [Emiliania huxleyi CCMP1516]|eukprot:XP_005773104.1 hypothetical protein EMIHUDRAFT_241977 [Emiliania huxleyi CCMP1516]
MACLTAATGRRLGASARLGVAIVASATRLDSTLSQELPHALARVMAHATRSNARLASRKCDRKTTLYSVDDKTCLLAGAEQEGPAHNQAKKGIVRSMRGAVAARGPSGVAVGGRNKRLARDWAVLAPIARV